MADQMKGWVKVVFAADCNYEEWDDDKEFPECPNCLIQYSDCPCPGPHMDEEYEYKEVDGILYAKKL